MKVHFKLNEGKTNADGYAPIVLHAYWKNYKFQFYTTERIKPKYWNELEQRVRRSHPASVAINNYLETLDANVKDIYRGYLVKGILPTPTLIKTELTPDKKIEALTFSEIFKLFIETLRRRGNKKDSVKHYQKLLNHFDDFQKRHGKIEIGNFTTKVYNAFIDYKKSQYNYHPNTIANWNKYLISFFNYCKDQGHELNKRHVKLKIQKVDPEKIYLTMPELMLLINAKLPERLEKVRDVFVFACVTGLRYLDLKRITVNNIIIEDGQETLTFIPHKSTSVTAKRVKRVKIPLVPIAIGILDKYKDNGSLLPVPSNQRMNDYLKELCQCVGINQLIETTIYTDGQPSTTYVPKYKKVTCHIARHTFATLGLINNIPVQVVSNLLGHSDLRSTMIYAKVVEEVKNRELVRAFGNISMN